MPGLWAFSGLRGQDAGRRIALKASVLVERGIGRIDDLRRIGGLLVVRFAGEGRPPIDHFTAVFVDQQDVLVSMRFLLAAVMLSLLGGVGRALAAALSAVQGQIGCSLQR